MLDMSVDSSAKDFNSNVETPSNINCSELKSDEIMVFCKHKMRIYSGSSDNEPITNTDSSNNNFANLPLETDFSNESSYFFASLGL